MSQEVRELEPKEVWNRFADLNKVPRPSKKEERIIQFMLDFGASLGLETFNDATGNVIIRKPATPGMEDRKPVVLQSHLDMVHQKNADTVFDFDRQGIKMRVDGDWVTAKGTTLGADNGLGVATMMALLKSTDIPHPELEALFTVDEETGMTGAQGLEGGLLKGRILLNLDTEEDDEIDIGCAGGIDITATRPYNGKLAPRAVTAFRIAVNGLKGGHSGIDIHKGLGNANKIMNRLLYVGSEHFNIRVSEIDGGGLRNAIPRESTALVVVDKAHAEGFEKHVADLAETMKAELAVKDPGLMITMEEARAPKMVLGLGVQEKLIKGLYALHNGVYSMSADIPDLVETSNNLAKVRVGDGEIKIHCLTRSSVESGKMDLAQALKSTLELAGCEVTLSGSYPGWKPDPGSQILQIMQKIYRDLFDADPKVVACHAGLECGILGQHYPEMEMVSFGPTIKGAHSPDEKVNIASVGKFWKYVKEILAAIPKR